MLLVILSDLSLFTSTLEYKLFSSSLYYSKVFHVYTVNHFYT